MASRKPTHLIKHEAKDSEGNTVRTSVIGAYWEPIGNRPGRIRLNLIPTNWDGYCVVWPFDEKDDKAE